MLTSSQSILILAMNLKHGESHPLIQEEQLSTPDTLPYPQGCRHRPLHFCTSGPYWKIIPVPSREEEGGWKSQMHHPCLQQGAWGPASEPGTQRYSTGGVNTWVPYYSLTSIMRDTEDSDTHGIHCNRKTQTTVRSNRKKGICIEKLHENTLLFWIPLQL